jgi:two-component system response regulator FixJ
MTRIRHVYLVDDDEAVRTALGRLLATLGYAVRTFPSGPAFLAEVAGLDPGCILLDLRMPGMSGLEVQQELASRGLTLPVVFLTAHGDLTTGVTAMKDGAVDFLQKPVREAVLLEALDHAWARLEGALHRRGAARRARARLALLTPRELEVIALVASGLRSRAIAARLRVSYQTAKVHRMRAMAKLGLRTLPELSRLLAEAEAE